MLYSNRNFFLVNYRISKLVWEQMKVQKLPMSTTSKAAKEIAMPLMKIASKLTHVLIASVPSTI